ncbi:MAG: sigma-70 family RNA polymerase sigma factor, partial [Polyangiaceae bacterium]
MNATGTRALLDAAYRTEGRRVLATLIRLLGSFDAAEEALHEAFAAAAEVWPREGAPENIYAWLVSAGRFKTIDRFRRQARLANATTELATTTTTTQEPDPMLPERIHDDELRLIFTCCHPSLTPDARIALTLREVAGLTTEEIARAYLVPAPTIAQRIVRAKAKIKEDAIPYEIPARGELSARLESALHVIYLVFNEGHSATEGATLTRRDLCAEALRLGRLVVDLVDESEALGLLALMLLHEARAVTRIDAAGDLVLLEHQDRSRWDRGRIAEAKHFIARAFASKRIGSYGLQAAIAAVHADAPSTKETDWNEVLRLYDLLARADRSSVVALNRAVALGMRDGPEAGLVAID